MEFYLVGGAVRDKYLGIKPSERDWVVVGASPEEMLALGYLQVGSDFPVFLHPKTKEEYALARTERKNGHGYQGFSFDATNVTLIDDLLRRDLTVNAMAEDLEGNLIDPYGGLADLKSKILRHVSSAFVEDPVRLLRIARFAAQLHGFKVHKDTLTLLSNLVSSGEINYLTAERVWLELVKALKQKYTEQFFFVLDSCNANSVLWPELLPENFEIILSSNRDVSPMRKIAALLTYKNKDIVKSFIKKYKVPKNYSDLILLTNKYVSDFIDLSFDAESIVSLLGRIDAWRKPERVAEFCYVCEMAGAKSKVSIDFILMSVEYLSTLKVSSLPNIDELQGSEISTAMQSYRIKSLQSLIDKQ